MGNEYSMCLVGTHARSITLNQVVVAISKLFIAPLILLSRGKRHLDWPLYYFCIYIYIYNCFSLSVHCVDSQPKKIALNFAIFRLVFFLFVNSIAKNTTILNLSCHLNHNSYKFTPLNKWRGLFIKYIQDVCLVVNTQRYEQAEEIEKVYIFTAVSRDLPFPPTSYSFSLPPITSPTCFDLLWFSFFYFFPFFFCLKCVWLTKLGLSEMIKR